MSIGTEKKDLIALVERMEGRRILVVGDGIIDRYVFGSVTRICPEAPVPVFVPEREETRLGGALNVAAQIKEFLGAQGGSVAASTPYSLKTRFMSEGHMLLRVDQDKAAPLGAEETLDAVRLHLTSHSYDAIIVSDYAKGTITEPMMSLLRNQKTPLVVDPKGSDWLKYEGCTVICPNHLENKGWDRRGDFPVQVIKCGSQGMWILDKRAGYERHIQTLASRVYDVTGAGDTVVALIGAALAAGGTVEQGAILGAMAAAYVVGEIGTVVCLKEELLGRLEDYSMVQVDNRDGPATPSDERQNAPASGRLQ